MCRLRRLLPYRVLVPLAALALAGCASSPASLGDRQAAAGASPRYLNAWIGRPAAPRRLSRAEEEWVIARAIAEHEMRHP
jgi:hypothetical protein